MEDEPLIYATSDLHGYPLEQFLCLLAQASFSDEDFLFVLGDVIDRNGDGGIALLQWMMAQPNVELILGNHEAMLLSCAFLFEEITEASVDSLDENRMGLLLNWMENGAEPTIRAMRDLRKKNPEALEDLLEYLREAPLYESVSTGKRDFLLVHSGLGSFAPEKRMRDYAADDLLWHRPARDERYFEDVITILGHTPTVYYGEPGRMFRTDTWIDIDTGASQGTAPMLLRLDDLKPYYASQKET